MAFIEVLRYDQNWATKYFGSEVFRLPPYTPYDFRRKILPNERPY